MHSSWFFRVKPIARLIFKARNFPEAIYDFPEAIDNAIYDLIDHPRNFASLYTKGR